ncbi:hypothetical protein [Bradyrhizobium sp. 930_D9_N1_4]|uniref:hypothetical protein n=1 Tax=Bradyrhizobium sp. 930_D9_N1_4 TaxID=3240374 RepID=UPI003F8CCB11
MVVPLGRVLARWFLLGSVALMPPRAVALEPERPRQEAFLTRALFAQGRVWLLSDAGIVSSVTEGQAERIVEDLPEKAGGLCVLDGRPMIVTLSNDGSAWTLRQRAGSAWTIMATVPSEGDSLLTVDCANAKVTLLTARRLVGFTGQAQHAVALSGRLNQGRVTSIYGTPDQVFVGFNKGEWGGGLRRIDRRSGAITVVERNATGELCGGPLNTECDPVNGIAAVPWKPDCIIAAVGLLHFSPVGRLVEICGDKIELLYERSVRNDRAASRSGTSERYDKVAFFGLTRQDDELWAVGTDGLHVIGAGGVSRIAPLPKFMDFGGVRISFEAPHLVLVLTNINQRHSVSGAVPILVPR